MREGVLECGREGGREGGSQYKPRREKEAHTQQNSAYDSKSTSSLVMLPLWSVSRKLKRSLTCPFKAIGIAATCLASYTWQVEKEMCRFIASATMASGGGRERKSHGARAHHIIELGEIPLP